MIFDLVSNAAYVFTGLLALAAVFQLALALGAPWGAFAYGGQKKGTLPTGYRLASIGAIVVYAVIAVIGLDRAGVIDVLPEVISQVGIWVAFGFFALGVIMNGISRSKPERYTMTPVVLVLAVLALIIALG